LHHTSFLKINAVNLPPVCDGGFHIILIAIVQADVAKLADAPDLGSGAARHVGSTPIIRTIKVDKFRGSRNFQAYQLICLIAIQFFIMSTVARENIGLLTDKLTIKVSKEDYLPSFEKKLKEYSKTANIPGFRKGMVPAGMIKKMYGASIFNDEVLKSVERKLYTYLNDEKPEIFGQPLPLENDLTKIDINSPADYDFGFEIGLKPDFTLADLSKETLTSYVVEATDTMIDEEVSRMQIKGGKMTHPEKIDNEENVLNLLFTEVDKNGDPVEGAKIKENSVILKYFTKDLKKDLKGKAVGDIITVKLDKSFEKERLELIAQDLGFEKNDSAIANAYFKLEIVKIGLIEKRELDEAFFNEVYPGKNISNEAEFRAAIKEDIEKYWQSQTRNQIHDQIYHILLDKTSMEFPETFLKKWLRTSGDKLKTADEVEAEFPTFSNQLKWTLISDRIIKDNKLDVSDEELRNYMKEEVMRYFGQMNIGEDLSWLDSYIDRMMKDEKQIDSTYRRLITEKLFAFAEKGVKTKEKKITAEEFTQLMHDHKH
jgi:trigger factor